MNSTWLLGCDGVDARDNPGTSKASDEFRISSKFLHNLLNTFGFSTLSKFVWYGGSGNPSKGNNGLFLNFVSGWFLDGVLLFA